MFKHIISTIVLGWLIASSAAAQETGTITGAVSADGTDYPLAGAVVRVVGFDNLGAVTDARGGFRIERVPIGPQRIRVENYGWEPVDRTVTVAVGVTEVRVRMPEAPVHVAGVTVTASGAAQRQMSSSAAVGAVTGRELRETKPSHPAQIAARIAGVWVNVAGSGEGHMTAIRQPLTTNPVYLYLEDGVPTRSTGFFNHNALYEINVPQAGRMEVLKGPGTALYGSDAIGGVINVETHAPAERASAELFAETGSSGWSRGLFSLSDTRGANGVRADLNLTRWDGWRDASGYDRHSGTIRWDHAIDASTKLKTVVSYSSIDQLDPSALSRSEYEANPKLNYYLFTTRNIRALRASTTLDVERGETHVLFTPYVRDNRMELVPFWMLAFDPVTYETGHKSVGMLLRVRQKLPQLKTTLTSGVDVDYSPGFRDEHQITMQRQGAIFESYQIGPSCL
jgi:outer membrane receptor protein involved in Fe transport